MTIAYILSQMLIIINYVILIMTYQLTNRKTILIMKIPALVVTGLSYVLLSAYSGVATVIVSIIRNIIFAIDEQKNGKSNVHTLKDYVILAIIFSILIISAIFTYNGFFSMMSVIGTMVYTYSIWQKSTKVYKIIGIPLGIIWVIYNIYIFSIFGIILETILCISAIIGYIRERRNKK